MNRITRILQASRWTYARRVFSVSSEDSILQSTRKCLIYCEKNGYIVKSPYESIEVPEMTIDRQTWMNLSKWENHIAIECTSTGRKYTYAKLRDYCAALAIRLRNNLQLKMDDVIAICLPNVAEYPIVFLGSIESGLKVTTMNPGYLTNEMAHQLSDCQVKAIFCEVSNFNNVKQACELAKLNAVKIITLKTQSDQSIPVGAINFDGLIDTANLNLSEASKFNDNVNLDETVILPYSSGTTGMPKGVMHSHKTFITNGMQFGGKMFKSHSLPTTNAFQDVYPCFLPFYHIYGLCLILQAKLSVGCKILAMRNYEINHFLELLPKHKATVLPLVPPVAIQLGHHSAVKPSHFESVRLVHCGASNLGEEDAIRFLNKAPNATFIQGYGMTEGMIACAPQEIINYGTVGFPMPNTDMKVTAVDDPSFIGLPPNQNGEILLRGSNIMRGYHKNIEATQQTITKDGWLRTGDIGYYDENGLFYVVDRLKELIKVNALQVAPAELENILRDHPDVLEAAVVGVSHAKCGEVPKAFIIRKNGSQISETEIQDYMSTKVSKHKQITGGIVFIENIPKTASGKILRREIKKLYT